MIGTATAAETAVEQLEMAARLEDGSKMVAVVAAAAAAGAAVEADIVEL